ncbi:PAS domain S-box protein [Pseudomonas stutzeri]|uniref:CHASE domain-containing protein n=1 Tax=Stutzerimonas stutzeri TaxID=316 RepID=UPI00190A7F5D|nr:CHASE domain-containing protein [Stutzerimonas stutzeri]MBK3868219.1 PAS domain S-box protein [Stutzerimonas stutzeri]
MDDRPALHSRRTRLPVLVALVLMAGLGGWIGWQWHVQEQRSEAEQEQRFIFAVDDIEHTLRERMRAYEMVLRGLAGVVAGSDEVSADDWTRAADQLQLQDFYPGIQGIALARHATAATIDGMIERIRADGRERFRMYPPGERDEYVVVDYIHPADWRNRRVLGFDLFSEATRREAIISTRDSGNPVLTGPLRLKQETEKNVQVGVLLFLPLYASAAPVTTEEERRQAFVGTLHGAFRLTDLMEGILGSRSRMLQLQLYDAANPDAPLLAGRAPVSDDAAFQRVRNIYMYGRSWQLQVASTPEYEALLRDHNRAFNLAAALTAAVLFSLLVGGYLYLRERALRSSQVLSLQLQEREARFRQLIEQLPVATLLCNASGRIELANQSAGQLLGSTAELLAGERVGRYVPGVLGEQILRQLREASQLELQAQREDGSPIPVAVSLTSFSHDDALYYVLNLLDLQARKRDEERFRNVVEASPNAFVLVDGHGDIVMVNRQTELLFGYSRQELLGQPVELLLPETLREVHRGLRQDFARHPEPRRMGSNRELFGRHQDGSALPVEIGLSPLRSGDEQLVQAVIIDISHRKAAERRLREQADQLAVANRYKSEFLANMSHELRTPLNSILILSDQLRQNGSGNLNDKQVRHADIIHRAGHELLQLINDVLDLAKIESGRMQLKLEPLNLRELLTELEVGLRPMAEQKGLVLKVNIDPDVPSVLSSDRARLQQVLHNLLTNALKFTEHGEVELLVSCPAADHAAEQMLQLQVRDTGIGIAKDQQERIFQAFQQIDGSISRQYGGTGLGLAITRQLVEVLGGEVAVASELGEGAIFTVRLPVGSVPATPAASFFPPQPQRRGRGPGLLIIEDDADFASVVAEVGQNHGFTSLICNTGQQGLEALKREHFAAVIIDILLPDISGWQVHRELRADERHQGMPALIISCVPQPHDWNDDGSRYLVKPVAQAELERIFIEIARHEHNPLRLLLVETDPRRRGLIRDHFERLGYSVTLAATGGGAQLAYAEHVFSVVVVDNELADGNGLGLLDALERVRSLRGVTVLLTSEEPLSDVDQRRLRQYSGTVIAKSEAVERMGDVLRPQPAPLSSDAAAALQLAAPGRRVLLVDEDVRLIYSLTAQLDQLGLQVVPATSAEEAIQRFEADAFDLVLLDMHQPGVEGPELARRLRQEHGCQVPIVALAGADEVGAPEHYLAAGADDVLVKPVEDVALLELLRLWLGLEQAAADAEEE